MTSGMTPCTHPELCGVQYHLSNNVNTKCRAARNANPHGRTSAIAATPQPFTPSDRIPGIRQSSIDNVKQVALDDKMAEFEDTDLGDHFAGWNANVDENRFEAIVTEPFTQGHRKFTNGQVVFIDADSNEVTYGESRTD